MKLIFKGKKQRQAPVQVVKLNGYRVGKDTVWKFPELWNHRHGVK